MFDKKIFNDFLVKAKKSGYASGDAMVTKNRNGATTVFFKEGDWEYEDRYYGGEPFGGQETIFYKGGVIWTMLYYGQVHESCDTEEIYPFLKKALLEVPAMYPFRGPSELTEGEMKYENTHNGYVDDFYGNEFIYKGRERVYSARYMGGFVDQR